MLLKDVHLTVMSRYSVITTKPVIKILSYLFTAYLMLLARQVTCWEFSDCYDDVGICLWTEGSQLTQSAAEAACQQRNNSFLPRVTDSNIQDKLAVFRVEAYDRLFVSGFWIDVKSVGVSSRFHWIGGSSFAGSYVCLCV